MPFTNPKPKLHDYNTGIHEAQENAIAEYKSMDVDVYFAFIDVLGFKQTFDENREQPTQEFAFAYKDTFQYFSLLMNSARFAKPGSQWNSGQTSDSLYFYTSQIGYLAAFIKIYSHFSLYAMSNDIFFRGGIAKGGLFVSRPHQFYGDSVIKAYLLENNIAKSPRIVLDQSTYDDLAKDKSALEYLIMQEPPKRNYITPFSNVSSNELSFLVEASPTELRQIGDEQWQCIHKNIQKNMKRFEFDDKNFQKYAFLQSEYDRAQRTR